MQAYSQRYYNDQSSQQEQQYYRSSTVASPPQYGMQQSQYGAQQSQYGGVQQPQYGGVQQSQYGGVQQSQYGMQKSSSYQSSQSQQGASMSVFGQDPFCEIMPSHFPPGTDPKIVACFNRIDRDGNGVVDDMELQSVLSSCNYSFNMRTVHLLMFEFTHSNRRALGPKEFVPLMKCLQSWRTMFQRFDRDRNGSIDSSELGQALSSLGFAVSPVIVNLLISKFNKTGSVGRCSLQYDSFIECCLTVRGLTETFNAKADGCGRATFGYEEFLLNILPFIIA
ncbi:calcium-binding protein CBP-like [Silene latifolia]|uniref:calcium-binding protein CBP-like n=1 Tax=Silene latifolia TaxID=37657 RepID=UPI003D773C92